MMWRKFDLRYINGEFRIIVPTREGSRHITFMKRGGKDVKRRK